MARETGGGQQRKQPRRNEDAETTEAQAAEASEEVKDRQEKLADDVDSMLDEIDEVLEENAEDFVRSFVQKGGE
ncbi:ubiquitin-like protein Pup [Phytoactinopolyspora limicola]|uniref:ubiquitin-like protein Pup n=1 Tax=Phytoactinopolyspora limicola TaxID=2715536 RepID=UPI001407F486|nr:ubiquitin-like protein Pup [Phytoactinopolyspora limicola]